METQHQLGRLTAPENRLRETLERVQDALHSLPAAYDERSAIGLIRALGACEAFVAPALKHLRTAEQERARVEYHRVCVELARAIRSAVAHPHRSHLKHEVVQFSQAMGKAARAVQSAFGWSKDLDRSH
jgi:hypothetical protein